MTFGIVSVTNYYRVMQTAMLIPMTESIMFMMGAALVCAVMVIEPIIISMFRISIGVGAVA